MASVEQIEARVRVASEPGFRGNLMARGEARSKVWQEGRLPDDAPNFSDLLSYDLLTYGYALLGDGLTLIEEGGDPIVARLAFETAAEAIESVIQNGPSNQEADFHRFVSATGYHLARYSARAFSLLHAGLNDTNLTNSERALGFLMLREMDALEALVREAKRTRFGDDVTLVESLSSIVSETETTAATGAEKGDGDGPIYEVLDQALADGFMSAMAEAMLGFQSGDYELIVAAQQRLQIGVEIAAEAGLVNQWWCHRLAKFLVGDLWNASFHKQLPQVASEQLYDKEWVRLRAIFIASLFRRSRAEIDLWPSQLEAASRALDLNDNMVVSLPTSAGKTRIAELCILACLAAGRRIMFITPLRALSAQTETGLQGTFGPLGKSVSSLYGSIGAGAVDDNILRERDIIVATPEKLDFALRNDSSLLDDIGLIVLDEGHMIGLGEREIRYEAQIQRLIRRSDAQQRRIVCLSAILPNDDRLDDFVGWLTDDSDTGLIEKNWRPTRLRFGELDWRGNAGRLEIYVGEDHPWVNNFITERFATRGTRQKPFPSDQRELCIAAAWRLVEDGQSVLIYCPEKRSVEPYAREIVRLEKQGLLPPLPTVSAEALEVALSVGSEWFEEDHPILKCLKLGVAVHHGSLPTPYRREVERLLRDGKLKVTISSPTLAQGLNLTATALIFHGLKRGRDIIEISQFRNVVGRAGRAFIDVEGTVLLPMFRHKARMRADWKSLIADNGGKEMESGLLRLVRYLMLRMWNNNKLGSIDKLTEYIANQAAWEFTPNGTHNADQNAEEGQRWSEYIALADTAVLSLLGETEISEGDVEDALDTILQSSLWSRRLNRQDEQVQTILNIGLKARAKHLWASTTAVQRKAYFLAGLGLESGSALDQHAEKLTELLIQANAAILNKDHDLATGSITEFAQIVFTVPPFVPRSLPDEWEALVRHWLTGKPLSDGGSAVNKTALEFIEEALIYKLPWALEAVRVRAVAHEMEFENGLSVDDFSLGYAVAALETGALDIAVSLLIQMGFNSRSGAYEAIRSTVAKFDDAKGLRQWLRSDKVRSLEQAADWPTVASHPSWVDFRVANRTTSIGAWVKSEQTIHCEWLEGYEPVSGAHVRVLDQGGHTLVAAPDFSLIGKSEQTAISTGNELLDARISVDPSSVTVVRYGPVLQEI